MFGDFVAIGHFYGTYLMKLNMTNAVPLVIFGAACLSLSLHIQPVGPCPCYEDGTYETY